MLCDSVWIIVCKSIPVTWNVHRKHETNVIFHIALYHLEGFNEFLLNENVMERMYETLIKFVVQVS